MEKTYTIIATEFSIQILESGWINDVILHIEMTGEKNINLKCDFVDREKISCHFYSCFKTDYTKKKKGNGTFFFSYRINNNYHETKKVAFQVYDFDSSPNN